MNPTASERASDYLAKFDIADAPGLLLNVLHKGELVLQWRGGLADLETQTQWSDQTVAPLASHTKCMTAFVVMRLHDAGVLSVDRPIGEVLDDLPKAWRRLTLRQCLGNVSGLPFDEQIAWLLGRDWRTPASCEWLQRVAERILPAQPHATYVYNDANFRLAVRIAEHASGERFEALLQRLIFGPLAMTSSGFARRGERAIASKAGVYQRAPDGYLRHLPYMELSGDGAAFSTMGDLRKWAAFLLTSAQRGDETLVTMRTPAQLLDGRRINYGLGLSLGRHRGVDWFAHSGAGAGYSVIWCAPGADLAIIVLANRSDIDPTLVALDCADFWLDHEARPAARAAFSAPDASRDDDGAETFSDAKSGVAATLERRGDVIRIDALGDYAFLRAGAEGAYETEDGRLSCVLDAREMTLATNLGVFRMEPCQWRPMDRCSAARLAGRCREPNIEAFARVTVTEDTAHMLIADGPDTPWRLDLEMCDAPGVFRAGALSGRASQNGGFGLITRGLPALNYVAAP